MQLLNPDYSSSKSTHNSPIQSQPRQSPSSLDHFPYRGSTTIPIASRLRGGEFSIAAGKPVPSQLFGAQSLLLELENLHKGIKHDGADDYAYDEGEGVSYEIHAEAEAADADAFGADGDVCAGHFDGVGGTQLKFESSAMF